MAMNRQRKTSNILNIFSYDAAGNIVIKDYSQVIRYSWNGTLHGFIGQLSVSSITSATTDTDKFLVSDGGILKFRTGAEILSDIGGQPAGSYVTTARTLTINGTAFDLSADRSWSVGTVTSVAALSLGTTGTDLSSSVATGTTTPVITLNVPTASALNRGVLSSADWNTFNSKLNNNGFLTGQILFGTAIGAGGSTSLTWDNTLGYLKVGSSITSTATIQVGGTVQASSFIKTSGTSSQFLMADGSVTTGGGGGMAIGGSITSATAGSVLFAGTSGVLQQDNANFFFNDSINRLGVGLNTPKASIDSLDNISVSHINTSNYSEYYFYEGSTIQADIFTCGSTQTFAGGVNSLNIYNFLNAPITFATNNTHRARITAEGRLLLGTTTEATYIFDAVGTARVSLGIGIGAGLSSINALESSIANKFSAAFIGNLGGARTPSVNYGLHFGWNYATSGESNIIWGTGTGANPYLTFSSYDGTSKVDRFEIQNNGNIVFKNYTSATSFTGTPVGYLGFDANGNILTTTGSGGGSITLSAIGSTPNANAATLTGSVLNLEPASASFGGVVTTGTQTFAGAKTFNSTVSVTSNLSTTGILAADLTSTGLTGSANLYGASVITRPTVNAGIAWGSLNIFINQQGILQPTFSGSATFQNSNYVSQELKINRITFAAAASTITMTQATGIRAYSNAITHNYIDGTNDGTISHFANIAMYGDYAASTARFTFINRYGLLINDFQEYGQGHTYTNRWAIYQDGANDNNYFKGKVVIGSTNTVGASPLNVKNLPTSASGLLTGDVWNNGGVLNIV